MPSARKPVRLRFSLVVPTHPGELASERCMKSVDLSVWCREVGARAVRRQDPDGPVGKGRRLHLEDEDPSRPEDRRLARVIVRLLQHPGDASRWNRLPATRALGSREPSAVIGRGEMVGTAVVGAHGADHRSYVRGIVAFTFRPINVTALPTKIFIGL